MPIRTFDFCALQFLNQWLDKESHYCELLASGDLEKQRHGLVKAGGHFRVARNLPKRFEPTNGLFRYQQVLDVLKEIEKVSLSNVNDIVNNAQQRISKQYGGRSVLSLTTKFLWLKFKSPIRIYDSQARIALGTEQGDFVSFNEAFSARYADSEEQVIVACANLKNVRSYSVRPNMTQMEVDKLVSEQWFRERVLDIYLWSQGSV